MTKTCPDCNATVLSATPAVSEDEKWRSWREYGGINYGEEARKAATTAVGVEARYRHKKRGSVYRVLHEGTMSTSEVPRMDDEPMVVYQCETDSKVWVRPVAEFYDGRFEELPSALAATPAVDDMEYVSPPGNNPRTLYVSAAPGGEAERLAQADADYQRKRYGEPPKPIADMDFETRDELLRKANYLLTFIAQPTPSVDVDEPQPDIQLLMLQDPNVVHLNMLRGTIAKPTWAQIQHLYPEQFAKPAATPAVGGEAWPDDRLANWARNWHWNDCAEDKPVDPSIYFRDMRLLKAFIAAQRAPLSMGQPADIGDDLSYYLGPDAKSATAEQCAELQSIFAEARKENQVLTATPAVDIPPCPKCHAPYHLEGDERYWEARWRDEKAENERLRAATPAVGGEDGLRDCLQSIADMSEEEPREPDDADWRFRCLEAIRAAKTTLAATPGGEREALAEAGIRHAEGLTAQLDRKDWKPSRAHIEQARNSIKKLADLVLAARPASPLRGRKIDAIARCMEILEDVPGENLIDRVHRIVDWHHQLSEQYYALSASPPEQPATLPWIDAEEGDMS